MEVATSLYVRTFGKTRCMTLMESVLWQSTNS